MSWTKAMNQGLDHVPQQDNTFLGSAYWSLHFQVDTAVPHLKPCKACISLGVFISPACLLLDEPRSAAAIHCWARSHDTNQMLLHLPPWNSPSPSQLIFQQRGSTSMRPVWTGKWLSVLSPSCSMSATWTQIPLFHARADLNVHLLWWWKWSQFLGRRCSTCSSSFSLCISHLDEGERMPENELRSPFFLLLQESTGLNWTSVYILLIVRESLLPPAAGFCTKALVRPTSPDSRRQQRP